MFIVLLPAIIAVGVLAAREGFGDAGASPDTRHWGQTVLSALLTGGVSFVVGRKVGGQ